MKLLKLIIFVILLVLIANLLYSNNQSVIVEYFPFKTAIATTTGVLALVSLLAGMIIMYVISLILRLGRTLFKKSK